jgi:hypothetical protein
LLQPDRRLTMHAGDHHHLIQQPPLLGAGGLQVPGRRL